ncbi:DUF4168 domain-containing protein [Methylophaga sp. OBS1]|uniref:DUF4168 domain-containing protein n=1 Tax=Methylophaga sp. OBS1 TaxID=2991933 RepID=UPI0022503FD0|nr:DUF4168 domain-containing protein [Methylophaga sp. OBS1]MCX4192327.1 DUF4168 domain-containing protein [Methylophaga sp. OBS1]
MTTALKTFSIFAAVSLASATTTMAYAKDDKVLESYKEGPWVEVVEKTTVTNEQLERYAELQKEVSTINQNFAKKINQAPNDVMKQSLIRQATISRYSVITDSGFDYDLYETIDVAVKTDPIMRARVNNLTGVDVGVDMIKGVAYTPKTTREPVQAEKVDADFSQQKLMQYASVQDDIKMIRSDYSEKIAQADTKSAERDLMVEAHREIADAIEEAGLYREEYANISLSLQQDPELRSQVQKMIKQSS